MDGDPGTPSGHLGQGWHVGGAIFQAGLADWWLLCVLAEASDQRWISCFCKKRWVKMVVGEDGEEEGEEEEEEEERGRTRARSISHFSRSSVD